MIYDKLMNSASYIICLIFKGIKIYFDGQLLE